MKKRTTYAKHLAGAAITSILIYIPHAQAFEKTVNLDNNTTGSYSSSEISNDFNGGSLAYNPIGNVDISNGGNGGKAIRIKYDKYGYGPYDGGQFEVDFSKQTELWCEYDLYLEPGFVWTSGSNTGGKLPGLAGGVGYTGGSGSDARNNGDGFSARYMWRANGQLSLYLYYKDMPGTYGQDFYTGYYLPVGQWVKLKQQIKMNTAWNSDGFVKVWANGNLILNQQNMRFMTTNHGSSTFMFSTFYGGGDSTWSPNKDTYAKFDNIKISKTDPSAPSPSGDVNINCWQYDSQSGISSWNGGVGYFDPNDWIKFNSVNLGNGYSKFKLKLATSGSGSFELRRGSPTGWLLGTLNYTSTGGWGNYQEKTLFINSSHASGTHDIYIVCKSGAANISTAKFSNN